MSRSAILNYTLFPDEIQTAIRHTDTALFLGGDRLTDSEKLDFLLIEIVGMKADIQGMKTEIRGMKADIQGVKTEIQGMKADIQGVKTEIQGMKADIQNIQSDIKSLNTRMDTLEFQLKSTERILRNQITKSESLILGEVERVHLILDQHIHNQAMHTALA